MSLLLKYFENYFVWKYDPETESLNTMNVATVLEGKMVLFIGSAKIREREGII